MVLKLIRDACHSPHLRFSTTSPEINTLPHLLQKHEQTYVCFTTYSNNRVAKWATSNATKTQTLASTGVS